MRWYIADEYCGVPAFCFLLIERMWIHEKGICNQDSRNIQSGEEEKMTDVQYPINPLKPIQNYSAIDIMAEKVTKTGRNQRRTISRMQCLQRSEDVWTRVRITFYSPLIRLQRKISGALYLQRTRAIPGDAGVSRTPAITDTDPHGSCSGPKK